MSDEIRQLIVNLQRLQVTSRYALVQHKTKKALADIKRARTLIEKAQGTLRWAEQYKP